MTVRTLISSAPARRAFAGHWHRLCRFGLFARVTGTMFGLTTLISLLAVGRASHRRSSVALGPIRGLPTEDELASASGLAACLEASGVLLGIVAVAITASVVAGDFERGVIRLWLVRQPNRLSHLVGAAGALAVFVSGAVVVIAASTVPVAACLANWFDVESARWWSSSGAEALLGALACGIAAALAWVAIGTALAAISRSVSLTITCVTTLVIIESIASSAWQRADQWLPATTVANLAAGGSPHQSVWRALAVTAAIVTLAGGLAGTLISRRDITE